MVSPLNFLCTLIHKTVTTRLFSITMEMNVEKVKKGRVASRNYNSFGNFVIRMAHEGKHVGISGLAVGSMDSIIRDLCVKITNEASNLAAMSHRDTVTPRDVSTAVQLLFGGELGRGAATSTIAPVGKVLSARPPKKPRKL